MSFLTDPNAWIGLLTLTALEVVLGIDNIVFITILAGQVEPDHQLRARRLGLLGAFFTRMLLLASIVWVVRLTRPLFTLVGVAISGRSIILVVGGLFLIAKATFEIHGKLEESGRPGGVTPVVKPLVAVVLQIMLIDLVFSLDSVITAVGMVDSIWIMVAATLLALGFMLVAAGPVGDFVERHPTVRMLALSFLVLIGTNLVAEGLGQHIPKGYTYFAMAFSVGVEMLNLRIRKAPAGAAPTPSTRAPRPA
ncbi:MAG: TerC family protein [Gemmatimonadaceae bacterium]